MRERQGDIFLSFLFQGIGTGIREPYIYLTMKAEIKTPLLLLLAVLFSSCKVRNLPEPQAALPAPVYADSILFMTYQITKGDVSGSAARLISQQKVPGKMKDIYRLPEGSSYLLVSYNDGTEQHALKMEHPLYKRVEYLSDGQQLASKEVSYDQAEFFIRLPLKKGMGPILITEKIYDHPEHELLLTTIDK